MHVLLLGATGLNGSLILQSLLSQNHTITALVRNTSSLPSHSNLTLASGSPTSAVDAEAALKSPRVPDAVIIAIGHRRAGPSPFSAPTSPSDLLEQTINALVKAIEQSHSIKSPKIIVNSSQGVDSSWSSMSFPFRFIFTKSEAMRNGLADHARLDAIVRESGLNFVLARPCRLVDGDAKPVRVWPEDGKGSSCFPSVTRASVSEWLVAAVKSNEFDGKAPVITN